MPNSQTASKLLSAKGSASPLGQQESETLVDAGGDSLPEPCFYRFDAANERVRNNYQLRSLGVREWQEHFIAEPVGKS
jgi:hypothetical protein